MNCQNCKTTGALSRKSPSAHWDAENEENYELPKPVRITGMSTRTDRRRLAQDYFNAGEIGRFLGLSTYTVQEVCRRGEMRHVRFGRSIRIRRQWADQFMAARERQPLQ